jgi:hypothetical protein
MVFTLRKMVIFLSSTTVPRIGMLAAQVAYQPELAMSLKGVKEMDENLERGSHSLGLDLTSPTRSRNVTRHTAMSDK